MSYSDSATPHIRELLRQFNWSLVGSTENYEEAFSVVEGGHAYMLLVHDSPTLPSIYVLRMFMRSPISLVTPTILFLDDEHWHESLSLTRLPQAVGLGKPLSPARFGPIMQELLYHWESKPMVAMRNSVYQYLRTKDAKVFFSVLKKFAEIPLLADLTSVYRANILLQANRHAEAERALLVRVKAGVKDLNVMFQLFDLYLRYAQPAPAYKLIQGLYKMQKGSMLVEGDLFQAAFLLGHYDLAAESLKRMQDKSWLTDHIAPNLVSLYMASGLPKLAEKEFLGTKAEFHALVHAWEKEW